MAQIATGQHQAAWEALSHLATLHPCHASIYRLQGGILQNAGHWKLALRCYRQALALDPKDSQAHAGTGDCLHAHGELPQALVHFREALRCQCRQPKHATVPPVPPPFDQHAVEDILWRVLTQLAAAGVHAFATSGTLLGLVREGQLLPFDKDLDIGLPFGQMKIAATCLQATGWQQKINFQGLINPQEWHSYGVALDLCGFAPDSSSGKVIGGFWFDRPAHPWSRVTEFPELTLQQIDRPPGKVWQLADPEAILVPLYGADWRVPDPDFDTVIAARNMRGFSLVTQIYAFSRLYRHWILGHLNKAKAMLRHTLAHLPDDELLQETGRLLGAVS